MPHAEWLPPPKVWELLGMAPSTAALHEKKVTSQPFVWGSAHPVKLLAAHAPCPPPPKLAKSIPMHTSFSDLCVWQVESQMWMLYNKLAMSDLDVRLRYFLCCDLESSLRKLLPDVGVRPFGSSVNGFGRYDCDLDLVVNLDSNTRLNVRHNRCW